MSENEEKSLDPLLALSSELPELPACWTFQHPERLYTADQMRAYATEATNYYGHLLRAANARGDGDSARLDWLDAQRNDDVHVEPDGERSLIACWWNVGGQCLDVRTAIDAGMEATNPAPEVRS